MAQARMRIIFRGYIRGLSTPHWTAEGRERLDVPELARLRTVDDGRFRFYMFVRRAWERALSGSI